MAGERKGIQAAFIRPLQKRKLSRPVDINHSKAVSNGPFNPFQGHVNDYGIYGGRIDFIHGKHPRPFLPYTCKSGVIKWNSANCYWTVPFLFL